MTSPASAFCANQATNSPRSRGLALAAIGAAIGVIIAAWLTRLMESLLFSVSRMDPVMFTAVPIAMVAVAVFACYVPARRAMQVDPMTALRAE